MKLGRIVYYSILYYTIVLIYTRPILYFYTEINTNNIFLPVSFVHHTELQNFLISLMLQCCAPSVICRCRLSVRNILWLNGAS